MNNAQQPINALPNGYRLQEYELVRVLGFGGFGMTYLGYDHNLDKPVAIKEYLPSDIAIRTGDYSVVPQASEFQSDFAWGLDRFMDEARTLARFDHRHLVKVYRFFEAHNTAYIVMEYAEGETLSAYLNRKGILTEDELKAILHPILDGLEAVHRADFLHRDIKPGNIVIRDADHSPVLIDFGAARQAVGAKSRSVTSIVTPGYAPIEQYESRGNQGPWTDIYALGGVCYRALTDDVPVPAMDRARRDPLVPVSDRCKGHASHPFLAAIDHALQVDETARPQSVSEWRAELGDAPVVAPPETRVDDPLDVERPAPARFQGAVPTSVDDPKRQDEEIARQQAEVGNSIEDLITTGLRGPYRIALDVGRGKMYWTDASTAKIQRANLDGSNVEDLITTGWFTLKNRLRAPVGIALDVERGKMYWTYKDTKKIQRANLDGSNVEDLITTGLREPEDIALDVEHGKIYWTYKDTKKIQRANLDGSNVEDLITTGLITPMGIALDVERGKRYWTDRGTEKIQRANLDGSNVEDLVTTGLRGPEDIALDVERGKMYWTDWFTEKIQRANFDGSHVEDLITTGLETPVGIALDVERGKMYWTDTGTEKIQRANIPR